jgi:hypothetical protein
LIIYNFSNSHPKLIRVKAKQGNNGNNNSLNNSSDLNNDDQPPSNEESLLWNMAFIVESLLQEVQALDADDLEVDLHLSEIIEELLLKNTDDKILYFQELANSLEISIV